MTLASYLLLLTLAETEIRTVYEGYILERRQALACHTQSGEIEALSQYFMNIQSTSLLAHTHTHSRIYLKAREI